MRVNDLPKYLLLLGCLFFLATAAAEETYQKRRGMGIEQWYIAVQKFGAGRAALLTVHLRLHIYTRV